MKARALVGHFGDFVALSAMRSRRESALDAAPGVRCSARARAIRRGTGTGSCRCRCSARRRRNGISPEGGFRDPIVGQQPRCHIGRAIHKDTGFVAHGLVPVQHPSDEHISAPEYRIGTLTPLVPIAPVAASSASTIATLTRPNPPVSDTCGRRDTGSMDMLRRPAILPSVQ
jgi:hypothetical protein